MIAPTTQRFTPTPTHTIGKPAAPIGVQDASIKTVSVEIKALTIGKKQMTLSVFRQLPEEDIVNSNRLELTGNPWGTVNYFHGACASAPRHLHVVWEDDGVLYRSCVYPDYKELDAYRFRKEEFVAAAARWVRSNLASMDDSGARAWWKENARHDAHSMGVAYVEVQFSGQTAQVYPYRLEELRDSLDPMLPMSHLSRALERVRDSGTAEDLDKASLAAQVAAGALEVLPFEWAAVYAGLERLDQLFIAV